VIAVIGRQFFRKNGLSASLAFLGKLLALGGCVLRFAGEYGC
jgi:hypothetical protein